MSKKIEIINSYKSKIKIIKKHNQLYFDKDKPEISDSDFDILKIELIELEKKNKFLKKLNLNDSLIGSSPSNKFKKIKHLKPMLSLSNAFDKKDMKDFLNKINNFLNNKDNNLALSSEPKIDGISATLIYKNGILINCSKYYF